MSRLRASAAASLRLLAVFALLVFAAVLTADAQSPDTLLHELFQDHAVLQRDQPVPVWGTADPGADVTVSLAGNTVSAEADADGHWEATLPAIPAGGPFTLVAQTAEATQSVQDVLVGDVYLCSGQSNMEWPVARSINASEEIAASENDRIRMLKVALTTNVTPLASFPMPVSWETASPETVGEWSAVCYFFARELQESVGVPLGLINASWGGTDIRAWMSAEALRAVGGYEQELDLLQRYAEDSYAAQAEFGARWERWWREQTGDASGSEPWQPEVGADWPLAPAQLADWKQWGVAELADHNGMVWHRATFDLTEAQAAQGAVLELGGIDEVDQTWINGHVVGNTFGWGTERRYDVPAEILRPGENVVVTNILNTYGQGGLTGEAPRRLVTADGEGEAAPLRDWRYQKVAWIGFPPRTPWEAVGGRTTIHNAMVAPMGPYALRGVLWYQGESNTGEGRSYLDLMRGLIAQWRGQFGDDVAAFIVQLANYGRVPSEPTESGWAEVREAQRLAALEDPNAALAVTIDIGNPTDIHPTNKQDVGRRLAQAARNVIYGEDVAPSGPAAGTATARGEDVAVTLVDVEGSLTDRDGAELTAFELCGAEPGSCRYATARIEGNTVVLTGPDAAEAERVRYCWGDSPVCTLEDASGLPVGPFELDVKRK